MNVRLEALVERVDLEAGPVVCGEVEQPHVAALAVREHVDVLTGEVRCEQGLAGRHDDRAAGRQRADDLRLGLRDASIVPNSSRCAGPMRVITPMSGRAIWQSAATWPAPRVPISAITSSVSSAIRVRVSGSPISLLWLCSAATVRRCGRQRAARMSFVEVLPVEPVMPTTRAPDRSRTACPRAAIAA